MENVKDKIDKIISDSSLDLLDEFEEQNGRITDLLSCLVSFLEDNTFICNVSNAHGLNDILESM
jgi:hypothetical protein